MDFSLLRGLEKVIYGLAVFIVGAVFLAGFLLGRC